MNLSKYKKMKIEEFRDQLNQHKQHGDLKIPEINEKLGAQKMALKRDLEDIMTTTMIMRIMIQLRFTSQTGSLDLIFRHIFFDPHLALVLKPP